MKTVFNLFRRKELDVQCGDYAMIRRSYAYDYKMLSNNIIFKVENVEQEKATVSFMDNKATGIFTETLPAKILYKVD